MNVKFNLIDGGVIEYRNLEVIKNSGNYVIVRSKLHGVFNIDFDNGLVYASIRGKGHTKIGTDPVLI